MDTHQKTQVVKECLQQTGDVVRCIDDRDLRLSVDMDMPEHVVTPEMFNGPQFLGGSLAVLALVAEWMVQTNPDSPLVFETVFAKMADLHELADLRIGVHMDDDHGKMTDDEILSALSRLMTETLGDKSTIPGCGFAGLLTSRENPLELSPKVSDFFVTYPNVVDEFVRRGAVLSILTEGHAPKDVAHAVENHIVDRTVKQTEAIRNGAQTYSHDTGKLRQVLAPLGEEAHELLETNARWLRITTNILAGMDPDQLDPAY